jgi:hypothetical protein
MSGVPHRAKSNWWSEADAEARRALAAGMIGWMLDAFDVMLFALVLPALSADLGLTKAQGGTLGSVMLIAAGRRRCRVRLSRTATGARAR